MRKKCTTKWQKWGILSVFWCSQYWKISTHHGVFDLCTIQSILCPSHLKVYDKVFSICVCVRDCNWTLIYLYFVCLFIVSDLSKAMLRVSSWVVTTGADSLAATCSSLGCTAPRRPKPAAPLLQAPPFTRPGESAVRDETHKVSQNTSCLSWSTSITSALESERREGDRWEKRRESQIRKWDRESTTTQTYQWGCKTQTCEEKVKRDEYWSQETVACYREKERAN